MKWTKVGSIRKSAKGNLYLQLDSDVKLPKGSRLQIQDPRKKFGGLVSSGKMSEAEANEAINKIPEYIRQDVFFVEESN